MSLETCLLEPTLAVEHPEATKGNKQAIDFMQTPSIQIKDWKISSDPSQNIHTHINNIQTYPLTYSKEQSIDINVIHV